MIKTPLSTAIGGVGFYTKNTLVIGSGHKSEPPFDPKSLFENGEQGVWLDPSDLSTMFQDAAGTVPVTGAGQPVGLILDKSKGLVLGPELINNGTFESLSFWTTNNTAKIELVSNKLRFTRLNNVDSVSQPFQTEVGKFYKVKVSSLVVSGGFSRVACGPVNAITSSQNTLINTFIGDLSFIFQATSATSYFLLGASSDNSVIDYDDVSIVELAGNHAYQTTSASRPILRQNATTGAYYLEFDGADDFLRVDNIDFTATDKVSLITGLRKLRDSPAESILELGVLPYDGVGTFWLTTNALAPGDVWIAIAQAWNARTGFSKVIPVANNFIFSAKLDFAGSVATDEVKPRLNGSTAGFTRGLGEHAGTGNFGNHPMYIGSRTGTSLQFNGHIYSLIGVGRLVTDAETKALEKELAKRTGVTLNV